MGDKPTTYELLVELKCAVDGGFEKNDEQHEKLGVRLRSLETKEAERKGRDGVINKIIMVVIGLVSAVFGAKYGGK